MRCFAAAKISLTVRQWHRRDLSTRDPKLVPISNCQSCFSPPFISAELIRAIDHQIAFGKFPQQAGLPSDPLARKQPKNRHKVEIKQV